MKQFKILVKDVHGNQRYVYFDAKTIQEAETEAKAKYHSVVAIEEVTPSMDLFEVF
ncbi:hypothetical protein ACQV2S_01225 [Facklamia sp. P13064]|uniref:hypothetical protein n=1 Tax=unclassified Facklamia TaxID=2622293 RepID=UPI003D170B91